jgi:hypothetical protein
LTTITIAFDGGADAATNDATPAVSGSTNAVDGRVMAVMLGIQTQTTMVNGGLWSVAFTGASLADGVYDVTASVSSSDGVAGSATQSLTIDTVDLG